MEGDCSGGGWSGLAGWELAGLLGDVDVSIAAEEAGWECVLSGLGEAAGHGLARAALQVGIGGCCLVSVDEAG